MREKVPVGEEVSIKWMAHFFTANNKFYEIKRREILCGVFGDSAFVHSILGVGRKSLFEITG